MAADHAQAAQGSGAEDSERGRLGNRIECLEAGLRKIQDGPEYVGAAVGAHECGKGAVEAVERTEAKRLNSDDRHSSITRLKVLGIGVPKVRALFEATYFAGLRTAGMPEE